jgi:alpha-beta hydrolase superfamily lysophospholipase
MELHLAASQNNIITARRVIALSPHLVHAVDYEGRTPLHVAAAHGHAAVVALLLESGASSTVKTLTSGLTPKQMAPESLQALFDAPKKVIPDSARRRRSPSTSKARSPTPTPASPDVRNHLQSPNSTDAEGSENIIEENKVERTEIVNPKTMRKVIIVVLFPFVALIFVNGIVFALKFVAVTAAFYFLVVGYFVSEITIRPPWYHHHPGATTLTAKGCPEYWEGKISDPMTDYGIPFEDVIIRSTDGYSLSGWYVPAPAASRRSSSSQPRRDSTCLVMVHGGGRDRRAWLRHLPMLHHAGYAALLFDLREHGLSSGNCNGFRYGMKERFDVLSAATYAKQQRGHSKVVAIGTSVGGSAVIMAAALDRTTIDGVVAENAITTCAMLQDYIITNLFGGYFSRHWLSVYFFNAFRLTCSAWLNIRIGNKPSKHCQALHCVKKISPRPVLLMHGSSDEVVPTSHSEQLYRAAAEPKSLWICDGAFHCGLHNKMPEEFEKKVFSLLRQVEKQ